MRSQHSNLNIEEVGEKINKLLTKYDKPLSDCGDGITGFLQINLLASDDQILKEFKDWLIEARSHSNEFPSFHIKRQFSSKELLDWHKSRVIPYWDLTTIAMFENATIPFHVLGDALFPEEWDVDLTERVRKVTKRKCNYIFSKEVILALLAQALSEVEQ